jgi:hypothetical protein
VSGRLVPCARFMLHKLHALVDGGCCDDNADALVHHELLLPGHLLTMFLKASPATLRVRPLLGAGILLKAADGARYTFEVVHKIFIYRLFSKLARTTDRGCALVDRKASTSPVLRPVQPGVPESRAPLAIQARVSNLVVGRFEETAS